MLTPDLKAIFIPVLLACFFVLFCLVLRPARSQDVPDKYSAIIRQHIYHDYPGMFHAPVGVLPYPFITPGSVYANQLWDWDSWLSDIALTQILTDQHPDQNPQMAITYGQGCVLNFLQFGGTDGYIPIVIPADANPRKHLPDDLYKTNMHKPVLAQHAAFLTKLNHDDADWLREKFPNLQSFIQNYQVHSCDPATGLFFWQDDLAIGVDTDPCTFFRPRGSSASIYLNCLMYKELKAMAYLATCLRLPREAADNYLKQAEDLKTAIQNNCWDERDGFFYSVDLNLLPVTNKPGKYLGGSFVLHAGHPRDYKCLIQRIEVWSGFMTMWAGIATPEQARRMVDEHLKNQKTLGAPYGVRTLSKMEKMYGLYASGNPSNWNGPVWGISNYMVFRGLLNYGFTDQATDLADKTIKLFGRDFEKNGALHEYYNPDTGEPIINEGFQNWNYLVLNIIAWREKRPVIQEF